MKTLENYGLKIPKILLPKDKENLKKWSVIACDQYTQDRDYWKKVEQEVADFPSTLKITLPEVYLGDSDKQDRINNINKTMKEYLSNNIFSPAFLKRIFAFALSPLLSSESTCPTPKRS